MKPLSRTLPKPELRTNNLRKWREDRGWTLHDLAQRSETTTSNISRIELGQQPRRPLLAKLVALFGLSESDFYAAQSGSTTQGAGKYQIRVIGYSEVCSSERPSSAKVHMPLLSEKDYPSSVYALEVTTDDNSPRYEVGDAVIVDSKEIARPLDMVLACANGSAVLRRYRELSIVGDKVVFELVPLREGYAVLRSDQASIRIQGVVIEHRSYRRP